MQAIMSSKVLHTTSEKSVKKSLLPPFPKHKRDLIPGYPVLTKIRRQEFSAGKQYYPKTNPYIIIQYFKSFRVVNRIKGTALALQKTQFIKKPKNPI